MIDLDPNFFYYFTGVDNTYTIIAESITLVILRWRANWFQLIFPTGAA